VGFYTSSIGPLGFQRGPPALLEGFGLLQSGHFGPEYMAALAGNQSQSGLLNQINRHSSPLNCLVGMKDSGFRLHIIGSNLAEFWLGFL